VRPTATRLLMGMFMPAILAILVIPGDGRKAGLSILGAPGIRG